MKGEEGKRAISAVKRRTDQRKICAAKANGKQKHGLRARAASTLARRDGRCYRQAALQGQDATASLGMETRERERTATYRRLSDESVGGEATGTWTKGDCAADRQSRQKMGKNCQGVATCPERIYCSMKLSVFASFAQAVPRKAELQSRYRFLSVCLGFSVRYVCRDCSCRCGKKHRIKKEREREEKKHP